MSPSLRKIALGALFALPIPITENLAQAADDTALRLFNVNAGNTGYVRVANDAAFSVQQFTLEAWVQRVGEGYGFSTDPSGAAIVSKPRENISGSNISSWHLHWTNLGQVHFNLVHTVGSSGVYMLSPAVADPLGRHHLAVTFDGSTIRILIDGAQVAQSAWTLGTVYYGPDDVLIGADNFALGYLRRFDGYIDDVRIWDYARSETEIANFKDCRLSGSESGLVSYWTFDGSDLSDITGHGHNGVAGGIPSSVTFASLASITSCAVGVEDGRATLRDAAFLSVFPQPTRGRVNVSFDLPRAGLATLDLYDVTGRKHEALTSQIYSAGHHELERFIGASDVSAAGLYFLRLQYERQTIVRRLVLVK